MRIVPRVSVRTNLILAILVTIVLSWVLSTGIANYVTYLSFRSLRAQMLANPKAYPRPIPEPQFGIVEFLTGRPPFPRGPGPSPPREGRSEVGSRKSGPDAQPRSPGPESRISDFKSQIRNPGSRNPTPDQLEPKGPPPVGFGRDFELRWLLLRLGVALALAGLVGAWLGRRYTRPLSQLATGAAAFHSGDFAYRIPTRGRSEFAEVATAMNEMAKRVSDHIGELEQDAERRRQFLADIAHELRSPVTTMRTMAGALQEGLADEPERRDRAAAALVRTSERMLRLVQNLMELAKLDLDELPLSKVLVDLRELADAAIQSHEAEGAAAGIVLLPLASHVPPPGGGGTYSADTPGAAYSPPPAGGGAYPADTPGAAYSPPPAGGGAYPAGSPGGSDPPPPPDRGDLPRANSYPPPPPGGEVPVTAMVDPDRITQVLDNVLCNAVRHAGTGAMVTVTVTDGDTPTITVSDTGKGIPAADLPHVLDPFFRSDTARTPGDSHTGLGLSIASRLVEAHAGRLTVTSEEGKGTTVTIELPKGA